MPADGCGGNPQQTRHKSIIYMSTTAVDVVVIGAGISGLSCARLLLQKDENLKVVVLEAKGMLIRLYI